MGAQDNKKRAWREVGVAGHCLHAGVEALERAEALREENPGFSRANSMCAVTMWAFALEAGVNHLLARLYDARPLLAFEDAPALEDAYWMDTRERIELFCNLAGIDTPDFGRRPFQVVGVLKGVRDSIAHGKPFVQAEPIEIAMEDDRPVRLPRAMQPAWELECTIERAQRHRDDVLEVYRTLANGASENLGDPMAMLAVLNVIQG